HTAAAPQPYLHSFPTRRSSDLSTYSAATIASRKDFRLRLIVEMKTAPPGRTRPAKVAAMRAGDGTCSSISMQVMTSKPPGAAARSEEHTSELQSRENLVCRLLL